MADVDLSKLSDADLAAVEAGDLSKVSDEGLAIIEGKAPTAPPAATPPAQPAGRMPLLPRDPRMPTDVDVRRGASTALGLPGSVLDIGAGLTGLVGENAISQWLREKERQLAGQAPVKESYEVGKMIPQVVPYARAAKAVSKIPMASRTAQQAAQIAGQAATGFAITPTAEKEGEPTRVGTATEAGLLASIPLAIRGAGAAVEKGMQAMGAETGAVRENLARIAEQLGFKIEPWQTSVDQPVSTAGRTPEIRANNQTIANQRASAPTGEATNQVTPTFIQQRRTDLGGIYNSIFGGKRFKITPSDMRVFQDVAALEESISPAHVPKVKQTAEKILQNYDDLSRINPPTGEGGVATGREDIGFTIDGEALQRFRSSLRTAAESAGDRKVAKEIYDMINRLDNIVKNTDEGLYNTLMDTNQKYRATMTLKDLNAAGGISGGDVSLERLGAITRDDPYNPLHPIGHLGEELGLRARWEGDVLGQRNVVGSGVRSLTPKSAKLVVASLARFPRSQAARNLQKKIVDAQATGGLGNLSLSAEEMAILNPLLQGPDEEQKAKGGVVYTKHELDLLRHYK